jgi:2-dehydro-3-deoxyphosphogluconate aldolase / (4S)-4-hydroxy-2-oxoglutarate aldolase
MANTSIEQTAADICKSGLVPVFYHNDEDTCKQVVSACFQAGLRVFEFTNRGERGSANFKALKKHIAANCPGMLLGAGTIFSTPSAVEFIDAGSDFIVSPAFIPSMLPVQTTNGTLWIPGCATISELAQARQLGVSMMKIFPGDLLGPKFAKAALSVMPGLRLMPTGGVEPSHENLTAWFQSGVLTVGMGSQLFSKELIEQHDWKALETKIKNALTIVQELKNKK